VKSRERLDRPLLEDDVDFMKRGFSPSEIVWSQCVKACWMNKRRKNVTKNLTKYINSTTN